MNRPYLGFIVNAISLVLRPVAGTAGVVLPRRGAGGGRLVSPTMPASAETVRGCGGCGLGAVSQGGGLRTQP